MQNGVHGDKDGVVQRWIMLFSLKSEYIFLHISLLQCIAWRKFFMVECISFYSLFHLESTKGFKEN